MAKQSKQSPKQSPSPKRKGKGVKAVTETVEKPSRLKSKKSSRKSK